jgi:hypothetical protein
MSLRLSFLSPQVFIVLVVILLFQPNQGVAQISPPGLDNTHVVLFGAVAINQSFGKKWFNQSYIGGSRFSDPNNSQILKKQAIYVIEQQTYRQFGKHWQLALCFSYRGQNMYTDQPPYDYEIPSVRRELRYYLRLFYRHQKGRFSFAYSLRPEWRNFYAPDWSNFYASPKALRYRAKAQAGIAFGSSKSNSFILSNELLYVQQELRQPSGGLTWTSVSLSENRIATYYRHAFKKPAIMLDVGMMQQLNFKNGSFTADYVHFAFDIVFMDPLGKPKS